jgi:replicative DNA helicase
MPDAPPHVNLWLERQALGEVLGFPEGWDLYAAAGLQLADFFRLAHRHEWNAIASVVAAGVRADIVTVGAELRRMGTLDDVGVAYHASLIDGVPRPHTDTANFVARELARLAALRAVAGAVNHGDLDAVGAVVDEALTRATGAQRIYDAAAQLQAVRADIERDRAGRLSLGFPTLDNILGGLRGGEVLGWMARPGIGKTLVLCHIAQHIAETEFGHVCFSLEMPAPQIVDRIAGQYFGLPRRVLRERLDANALDVDALDVDAYANHFRRFVLVDAPGLDVATMAAKLRQIQAGPLRDVPIRLVTVDHLGLIGGDRRMSTYDRVSMQARELKELSKRFNVTVLLAVQVNRESGGDGSKELHLGSARDSGVVEEAMDYLVAMRRLDRSQMLPPAERERYRDVLFAKIVKNRHGSPGTEVAIRIDPQTLRLREDASVVLADDDLAQIAAGAGRGRR